HLGPALLVGLPIVYLVQLPLVRRVSTRLQQQNDRLEDLLRHEKKSVAELRELSRMKDEFVSVTSHELRTPLTSIVGYAKTLRRPEFAGDGALHEEFLGSIERQGKRLAGLVEKLLSAS